MQTLPLKKTTFTVKKSSYLAICGALSVLFGIMIAGIIIYGLAENNPTAHWGYLFIPALLLLIGSLLLRAGRAK